jgi:hypothetical protein
MRSRVFVFVALLLGACGSRATSLDGARSEFVAAMADYQECMRSASGELANNTCEPKRLIAEDAERTYKNAMSAGVTESPR